MVTPKRIISLVPSQTELLYHLGLAEEVVGITKFCIHPNEWFRTKVRVGGTKTVNINKVKSLSPDLILANKEENVKEQIEALGEIAPVYVSDIKNLEDALDMIKHVGKLVDREQKANEMAENIHSDFELLKSFVEPINQSTYKVSTAYLIWKDPYMAAGGDTFINDLMLRCGLKNVFSDQQRYPEISTSQLSQLICEVLLLSSEPYPFKQKHIDELQQQLRGTKILLVDGEMFSWYGSRLLHSADYFKKLIQEIQQLN
ncbi:MAG TPA: helical backbone metal receptor [Segetibacter sp.]|jgi:ABC-type Fe3+-hydroxamate transport system substrate-binding protein